MKGWAIFIAIVVLCLIAGSCGSDEVTYYYDENGNGQEDWGEAVWYEDDNGIHVLD